MPIFRITLFLWLACWSTVSFGQKATYVANGGVLITVDGTKVIIDALFSEGRGKFSTPGSTQIAAMEKGTSSYSNLSLALVTHAHPDHVDVSRLASSLKNQPKLKCLTTPQVIDSVKSMADNFEAIQKQLLTFPTSRSWKLHRQEGVSVKAAYARHAGKINAKVMDLIFVVDFGDKKIMHLGDADMDPNRFEELKLKYEDVDIAFVPFWYMTGFYGAEVVHKYIKAKKIVAVHFPESGGDKFIAKIKQFVPEAIIFQKTGQLINF